MNSKLNGPVLIFINEMQPLYRFIISLVAATVTFLLRPETEDVLPGLMFAWIAFSGVYLTISWVILIWRPVHDIRKHATKDDGSKIFVFIMVLLSSFAGMFMVLLLMISPSAESQNKLIFSIIAISGMLLSWIMVHSIFTFHYAHIFYDNISKDNKNAAKGLIFPENDKPDYIDFAYFSFVIGCAFQVSDVAITSRKIRRLVFIHSLLAFGLNTFVVALTINLIAGLSK